MAAPGIPQNVLVQQGNGQVLASWNLVPGATQYIVQRSTDGINFTTISTAAPNQLVDTTALIGVQYFYQVASTNGTASAFSQPQSVVPCLSGQMSLGQLRLLCYQAADMQNNQFVGTVEANTYINQSYYELYDLLVTTYEDYYLAPQASFLTGANQQAYPLPDGQTSFLDQNNNSFVPPPFYKMMGVDDSLDAANARVTLHKFNFIERNRYVFPNITSTFLGVFNLRYRVMDKFIEFIPTPASNQRVVLWYIPKLKTLLQDSDLVDGISGWTEYLIVDVARKMARKEESYDLVAQLQNDKLALIKRIEESAANRDAGAPDVISQTRRTTQGWGDYTGFGGDSPNGGY